MNTRLLFLTLFLLSGNLYMSACSCLNIHTPLEDMICYADTTGGLVLELEMTIRIGNNQEARFRIVDVHVGSTDLQEINLSGLTSCAWGMGNDDQPGKRFLYFTHPDWLNGNEGQLFTCALSSNIYRMNNRGTRVEYPVEVNGRNDRLAYRNASAALAAGCTPGGIIVDRLRNLYLSNNPGPGLLNIMDSSLEFPRISSIEVYNVGGRLMRHIEPVINEQPAPIDLRDMPTGVYLVVVRQGRYLKTLRYVKR
jgi:hypothetical protein